MFVAALGLVGTAGIAAATLFVLAHGLVKSALFICAGNYLNRFRSLDEGVLGGKGREAKATTILFLIGGVALAGLPPFGISAAKSLYDIAMTDRRLVVIAVVAAIASAIDAGAVLRSGLHIGFGIGEPQTTGYSPREEESECPGDRLDSTPWTMVALPALLLALALWVGISVPLHDGVASAARVFTDSTAYIHAVMNGGGRPVPWIAAPPDTMTGRAIGVAVTLCAALLAFAGLYRRRVPPAIGNVAGAPMRWLRARHSGKFTDYVTYMMAGVAIYGCWFLASLR
jgi:multicomponent Na+:H+ antiporter subunit D